MQIGRREQKVDDEALQPLHAAERQIVIAQKIIAVGHHGERQTVDERGLHLVFDRVSKSSCPSRSAKTNRQFGDAGALQSHTNSSTPSRLLTVVVPSGLSSWPWMSLRILKPVGHHTVRAVERVDVIRVEHVAGRDEEDERHVLAAGAAQEQRLDFAAGLFGAGGALAALVVEVKQALTTEQLAVDEGEKLALAVDGEGRRVSAAGPEVVGDEAGERGTVAGDADEAPLLEKST